MSPSDDSHPDPAIIHYGRLPRDYVMSGALADCSHSELLVYALIASHAGEGFRAWPSIATLARASKLSKRTVQRAVAGLVDGGHMEAVRRGGHATPSTYTLSAAPVSGSSETSAPDSGVAQNLQIKPKDDTMRTSVSKVSMKGDTQDVTPPGSKDDTQDVAPPGSKGDTQDVTPPGSKDDTQCDTPPEGKGDTSTSKGDILGQKHDTQGVTRKGKRKNIACSSEVRDALLKAGVTGDALSALSQLPDLSVRDVDVVHHRATAKASSNPAGLLVRMLQDGDRASPADHALINREQSKEASRASASRFLDSLPVPSEHELTRARVWLEKIGRTRCMSVAREAFPALILDGRCIVLPHEDERVLVASCRWAVEHYVLDQRIASEINDTPSKF